ncbi:MAG: T9SS type A sorting domain-containing protein, partial [Bacteroidota bacterium]|nr:T9SS type A sorting domain-containing protein [Bacteroidota bacterium]MDX5429584.1 T9SS type A sorting domain-containing protein [Bacteroidota bacterium]MDX5468368.1 T9SS type A sorting domain-containing protein [Bacteroidota bacterium]
SGLNIYELGDYNILYTAEDASGNQSTYTRTIRVVDTEKPVVIAPPVNVQRWTNTFDPMAGVSALDNYWTPTWFESNQAIEIVYNNVDVNYPGIYNVVYRAKDGSGNTSTLTTRIVNVWTPTSLEGLNLDAMVNVYPNPSNGKFTLKLDEQLGNQVEVRIMDALGNVVYTAGAESFMNNESTIDLSNVSAGVYMVQLTTEFGSTTKRVVFNK